MANYSFEKGKYGGNTGMIFPYFREISGLLPVDQEYKEYIPAGFLKCRGQILSADQYPALAELLGVGSTCIYKKTGTTLQERNTNGTGGTFQLPDLGSKYIASSSNPGNYANTTTISATTNQIIQRAGIELTLEAAGDQVEFNYTGNFYAPATPLSFSGNWIPVSPPSKTAETTLFIGNIQGHAHDGTYTIGCQTNLNSQGLRLATYRQSYLPPCYQKGNRCGPSINAGVTLEVVNFNDSGSDDGHSHPLANPSINAPAPTGRIPELSLSASSITTTVKLRTKTLTKADSISPKFVICEYLIKY